jgi:hypothetical protein
MHPAGDQDASPRKKGQGHRSGKRGKEGRGEVALMVT